MKYVVHFGSRVYLGQGGTMVLLIDEAEVYFSYREANLEGRKYTEPPHCAPSRTRPFFEVCKIG